MNAMEIVDQLAENTYRLVEETNRGRRLTQEQFTAAFHRTFNAMLAAFRKSLAPDLRARFDRSYMLAYEESGALD